MGTSGVISGTIQNAFISKTESEIKQIIHRFESDERNLLQQIYRGAIEDIASAPKNQPLLESMYKKITPVTGFFKFIASLFEGPWFFTAARIHFGYFSSSDDLTKMVVATKVRPQIPVVHIKPQTPPAADAFLPRSSPMRIPETSSQERQRREAFGAEGRVSEWLRNNTTTLQATKATEGRQVQNKFAPLTQQTKAAPPPGTKTSTWLDRV